MSESSLNSITINIQDSSYLKAQLNLAIYNEKAENLEEALTQNKKLLEMNPSDVKIAIKIK